MDGAGYCLAPHVAGGRMVSQSTPRGKRDNSTWQEKTPRGSSVRQERLHLDSTWHMAGCSILNEDASQHAEEEELHTMVLLFHYILLSKLLKIGAICLLLAVMHLLSYHPLPSSSVSAQKNNSIASLCVDCIV